MQVPSVPALSDTPGWLAALRSPAATLTAFAVAARLIVVPALMTLLRRDLKPELTKLADHEQRIPALERRVDESESDLRDLKKMPETLARIEEQLKTLLHDRRAAQRGATA